MDSDDRLPDNTSLEVLVRRAEEENADLVFAGYRQVVGEIAMPHGLIKENKAMDRAAFMDWMHFRANSFFVGALWNKLFRTDLIQKRCVRFTDGLTYGEDFLFVMHYMPEVHRVAFTDAVVYDYVRHTDSMTFKQAKDCVRHPVKNTRVKQKLYHGLCDAYRSMDLYEQYKSWLWLYLFRVTLSE